MPKTLALCYSGEPRDILKTINNHRTNLWRDHTVHVYVHAWHDAPVTTPYELGFDNSWKQFPNIPVQTYLETLRPYRYILQSRSMEPQVWQDRQESMYRGIHTCLDLVDPSVRYDYIVRCRPDVWFLGPIDLPEAPEPTDIYLLPNAPVVEGFDWDVPNDNVSDFFAVCTPQSIQHYRSFRYDREDPLLPTKQLGAHLLANATVKKIPVYSHLYRNLVWRNFQATD